MILNFSIIEQVFQPGRVQNTHPPGSLLEKVIFQHQPTYLYFYFSCSNDASRFIASEAACPERSEGKQSPPRRYDVSRSTSLRTQRSIHMHNIPYISKMIPSWVCLTFSNKILTVSVLASILLPLI